MGAILIESERGSETAPTSPNTFDVPQIASDTRDPQMVFPVVILVRVRVPIESYTTGGFSGMVTLLLERQL